MPFETPIIQQGRIFYKCIKKRFIWHQNKNKLMKFIVNACLRKIFVSKKFEVSRGEWKFKKM